MNNDITKLHQHLFGALEGLSDKKEPMDIERARAIADVAQVVINSAKVEVEYIRVTGGRGSGFIPEALPNPDAGNPAGTTVIDQRPGVRVTRHQLKG